VFVNVPNHGECIYVCMYVCMQANSVSAAFHFFVALVGSGVLKVALKDQYRFEQLFCMYVCMYVCMCVFVVYDLTGFMIIIWSRKSGCLLFFSLLSSLSLLVVYAAIPETKGTHSYTHS